MTRNIRFFVAIVQNLKSKHKGGNLAVATDTNNGNRKDVKIASYESDVKKASSQSGIDAETNDCIWARFGRS